MPLIGSDFTARQRAILRTAADLVSPGMSDAAVLAWATTAGAAASVARAVQLAVDELAERHNAERRSVMSQLSDG